jgi:osmotically inducible lipoprotein OsmB
MSTRDRNVVGGAAIGGVAGAVLTGGSAIGTVGGAAVGGVIGNEIGKR